MRVAGRGEQGPGPGAWRSGGGLGPVGFPQVGASGGGGGLRGGGEEMAVDGQPGPGELLPPPPPPANNTGGSPAVSPRRHLGLSRPGAPLRARHGVRPRPAPQGARSCPALPCPQPALMRKARPLSSPGWLPTAAYTWLSSGSDCPISSRGLQPL